MTRKKENAEKQDWQELLHSEEGFLRPLLREIVQQGAEMEETLQAGKSERSEGRLGYRSCYYPRTLIARVGKLELRVPQDRQGRFGTEVF